MKKAKTLAKALFSAAVLTFFLSLSSCKQENKQDDTKEVAEDQNDAKFENNDNKDDDSDFLVAAAETDLMEIEIGKLALSKSTNAGVKDFANMLVADHTKSSNELKPFAEKLQVSLPMAITEKGKDKYNELNDKNGKDFDQKFADMMVDGHQDAIDKMQKAAEDAHDPAIRTWASNMVPTLKGHLEHAKMLQDNIKNNK
ncbi:MAG: DUF4142 domain-containing protein [Flavobacterium sp.]|nr:MAG: DUF4142 domain-containing protein [Flavobacterium sp.]